MAADKKEYTATSRLRCHICNVVISKTAKSTESQEDANKKALAAAKAVFDAGHGH